MYSNNRRRSGKKFVLDTDISSVLEKRIRTKIVQDRIELKDLIGEHINKRRAIEGEFKIDPKGLDDDSLRERIQNLEKIRANLLRIISIKNEYYSQFINEADSLARNKLSKDVELENKKNEERENKILTEDLKNFSLNVKDLVEKIKQYKENYDKKKTTISRDS